MTELPLLLLSPNKENRVEFSVFVEGTMSTAFTNPFVRLVLAEEEGRGAWYFSTRKIDKGTYESTVKLEEKFVSNKLYRAYIEVILQDYYFVPVESLARFDTAITEPKVTMTELKGFKKRYTTDIPTIRVNEHKKAPRINVTVGDVQVINRPKLQETSSASMSTSGNSAAND